MRKKLAIRLRDASIVILALFAVTAAVCKKPLSGDEKKVETAEEGYKDELMEITIGVWNGKEAFAGDDVLRQIEEQFLVKFQPVELSWDDYMKKVPLWASADCLPDIFVGDFRNSIYYPRWIQQGLLREIPDDLEQYPHLEEYLSGDLREEALYRDKLYCIPRQSYDEQCWSSIDRMICYRWDLAQAAGVTEEPKTWEEFEDMMLKIIEADPQKTGIGGMTASERGLLSGMFLPYACPIAADSGSCFKWVKTENGEYQPAYFAEDLLPAFRLARGMYQKGVIEPDIAMTTNASANEKFLKGKSAAILISGGFRNKYLLIGRYWKELYGTEYTDDVKALALMPDKDGNKTYPMWGRAWSESYISNHVDEEKMERILKIYDYLLTEEGTLLSNYGPEGELYEMVDGRAVLKDDTVSAEEIYPSCGVFSVLARWTPAVYDRKYPLNCPEEYAKVDWQRAEEAKKIKIPEYDLKCSRIALELELDISLRPNEDFLVIMTGTKPVETMWEETVERYWQEGVGEAVRQVNEAFQ